MRDAKCCLSYWFPRLQATGVRVPRTQYLCTELAPCQSEEGDGYVVPAELVGAVAELARLVRPEADARVFLRTGMTSGKHCWKRTCLLENTLTSTVRAHIGALAEYSEMADILGLPTNVWVVREFIPLESAFCTRAGMPVNRERRYFIDAGKVVCHHPYWPLEAVRQQTCKRDPDTWELLPLSAEQLAAMAVLNAESAEEVALLTRLSERAAAAFVGDGPWSLDWARGQDGEWYAIDMAEAHRSYHAAECPHQFQSDETHTDRTRRQHVRRN